MTNNDSKELKEFKIKLQEKIEASDQVFIVTHKNPDLDAIGSAIGISLIAKKLKKNSYIIMDDKIEAINTGVLTVMDAISNDYQTITNNIFNEVKTENNLLIVTDTNKTNCVCCEDYLDEFKSIIIIDHHNQDTKTIKTINKFIKPQLSSTCEIVATLLDMLKINYSSDIANYLLAGITLDTNQLRSPTVSEHTLKIAAKLIGKGANINYSNELLDETFETDIRVHDLIKETDFYNYSIAICKGKNEDVFTGEELAKAANYTLKFKPDIVCIIGRTDDNTISISSRSNGKINVSKVMELFGGGGDNFRGAAKIEGSSTDEVEKKLIKVLKPKFYISNRELKNEES